MPSERHSPIGAELNSDDETRDIVLEEDEDLEEVMNNKGDAKDEAWDNWEEDTDDDKAKKSPSPEALDKAEVQRKIVEAREARVRNQQRQNVDVDIDALDIKVSATTKKASLDESASFDYFADMEPVIKKKSESPSPDKTETKTEDKFKLATDVEIADEDAGGWGSDGDLDWGNE